MRVPHFLLGFMVHYTYSVRFTTKNRWGNKPDGGIGWIWTSAYNALMRYFVFLCQTIPTSVIDRRVHMEDVIKSNLELYAQRASVC